jgi:hypothetical protein
MTDEFEQSMEIAEDYAAAWRFDSDGPLIVGHVIGFGEFDAGWGPYPIVTLRLADGRERSVHCQREVLARELAKARPRIGERVGIKWLGQPEGKSYHRYVVRIDRSQGDTLDWSRYVPGVEDATPPVTTPAPPPPNVPPAASGAAAPAHAADDDISF